ncbi:hypothetical protein ES703_56305 [subsurface metagenome]
MEHNSKNLPRKKTNKPTATVNKEVKDGNRRQAKNPKKSGYQKPG